MTKPNEKRRVFDHIANFSEHVTIEELYEELVPIYNDIKAGKWMDTEIEFPRSEYDDPMVITGYRLETDKEYADRLKYEAKCEESAKKRKASEKKKKEENERKEYERLKKKFEKEG